MYFKIVLDDVNLGMLKFRFDINFECGICDFYGRNLKIVMEGWWF